MLTVDVADVVDPADVRVRDAKRHAHLAQEPIQAFLIALEAGRQELQRDRLAELEVVGAVDLAHPAASQQSDHAVAAGNDRTGQETRAVRGIGGGSRAAGAGYRGWSLEIRPGSWSRWVRRSCQRRRRSGRRTAVLRRLHFRTMGSSACCPRAALLRLEH